MYLYNSGHSYQLLHFFLFLLSFLVFVRFWWFLSYFLFIYLFLFTFFLYFSPFAPPPHLKSSTRERKTMMKNTTNGLIASLSESRSLFQVIIPEMCCIKRNLWKKISWITFILLSWAKWGRGIQLWFIFNVHHNRLFAWLLLLC